MTALWQRIQQRAAEHPDLPAVRGELELSYRELVRQVSTLADRLAGQCGPGDVLAVRTSTVGAGLLAVLAAGAVGAAFLPLDVSAPPHWQEELLRDAGACAVLTERAGHAAPVDGAPASVALDLEPLDGASAVARGTAYLIYTSGSTGRPKAVLVGESALLDRLNGLAEWPGFTAGSSFLALTALSFDISLAELLLPLWAGGTIVAAPPVARLDPAAFAESVSTHRPCVIQATPSFWRLVLAAGWTGAPGAVLWCGGEPLSEQLARELLARCRQLWNVYGPTEATIWATAGQVRPGVPVSLGSPLPGTRCSLLDADGTLLDQPGAQGEIVLSGAGLASGYHGNPPEQQRFGTPPALGEPAYFTGDRARLRADGSLEFLGRTDSQVKLRGHRLELGQVESAIEAHPDVRQAAVFLCSAEDPARAHLVAVVAAEDGLTDRQLRSWLVSRVPQIMLPKRITVQASLPRTTAGKLDRVVLQSLVRS